MRYIRSYAREFIKVFKGMAILYLAMSIVWVSPIALYFLLCTAFIACAGPLTITINERDRK